MKYALCLLHTLEGRLGISFLSVLIMAKYMLWLCGNVIIAWVGAFPSCYLSQGTVSKLFLFP